MKKLFLLLFLVTVVLSSCKKDIPEVTGTVAEQARDYLYDIMNEYYLWYDQMPVVVKTDYKDPYELMDAMKYKTLDRWSFVQTFEEYLAYSQGSFVGHGIRLGLDPENKVRIVQIYKNSPLYAKGVRRGWIINKLNEVDLAQIFIDRDSAAYNSLIGPATAGVINKFLFQIPDSIPPKDTMTIVTSKSSFTLNTVILYDTLQLKSGIAGHLVFDQFIPPSNQELETAFAFFTQNNITSLILDLRYNPGGDFNVLANLGSYIAGAAKYNLPFLKFNFNAKYSAENETYNFRTVSYPVNLTKLITINTRSTGSASEDLINGLKPYLDVKCLGDTTNGKPVGMILFNYKIDFMFWPICYSVFNASNQGEFYDGIIPEKYVPDDITHDWSDRNELCLKEAIYYLENGSTSPKGTYNYQQSIQFSEKPERFSNTYLIKNK